MFKTRLPIYFGVTIPNCGQFFCKTKRHPVERRWPRRLVTGGANANKTQESHTDFPVCLDVTHYISFKTRFEGSYHDSNNQYARKTNKRSIVNKWEKMKKKDLWKYDKNTCGVEKATSRIFLAAEVAIPGWPSSSSFQVWLFNFLTMCYPQWSWDQFLDQFILSMKGSGGGIHTVGGIEKRCPKLLTVASLQWKHATRRKGRPSLAN